MMIVEGAYISKCMTDLLCRYASPLAMSSAILRPCTEQAHGSDAWACICPDISAGMALSLLHALAAICRR